MRILTLAAVAAFFAAGSLAATAQTTAAPSCKGLEETACQAPTCKWVAATKNKDGSVKKKGYCKKGSTKKKS